MKVLKRFFRPVRLTTILDAVKDDDTRASVAVTFDDGYADNYFVAAPILKRYEIPATFFLTAAPIARRREFWWDDLERLLRTAEQEAWFFFSTRFSEVEASQGRYLAMWRVLATLPGAVREAFLDDLRRSIGVSDHPRESHRPMTPEEVRQIASSDLFDVGGHGLTHANLAGLSRDDQWTEIAEGKSAVESMSARKVSLFAYPFGRLDSAMTPAILAENGFRAACSTVSASVPRSVDPWRVPRCNVIDTGPMRFVRLLVGAAVRQPALDG